MQHSKLFLHLLLSAVVVGSATVANAKSDKDIKLVLQITVDGLRADLINRYQKSYGKGGFNYLLKEGANFTNAHYQHANTETIVGHATLATGTYPSQHGMVGNVMFDRATGELTYNIEDPDAPLLPTGEISSKGEEVDPSQKVARTSGRSPRAILVPTFSDGLAAYYGGHSKIFGVSSKDRSAVAMAGHTGKALWFSPDSGDFITSRYYYDKYPDWVSNWNNEDKADKYAGTQWPLSSESSTYMFIEQDDRPYEADLKGYGRTFPHAFHKESNKLLYTQLLASSVGDQLLLDFSKTLITNEKLGKDDAPDYLSISFSSVDVVNHFFGPSSLENEEVIRQLDKTLAELFKFIDDNIGLEHTLIVLSADHGIADLPEYMSELGYVVGRHDPDEIVAVANKAGKKLGIDEVVYKFFRPYLYLNEKKIAANKLNHAQVAQAIATAITNMEGINLAVSTDSLAVQQSNPLREAVRRNHHEHRSGDIYVIQDPYWFLFDEGPIAGMHGTPWRYDTHVPIIFAGAGIDDETISRLVHPVDVAPTIANIMGMTPPAASQGAALTEIFE
jgi:predicted AlkP superfamily pyrophosphatase or phosphodiesterase